MKLHHISLKRKQPLQRCRGSKSWVVLICTLALSFQLSRNAVAQVSPGRQESAHDKSNSSLLEAFNSSKTASDQLSRHGLSQEVVKAQAKVIAHLQMILSATSPASESPKSRTENSQATANSAANQSSETPETQAGLASDQTFNRTQSTAPQTRDKLRDAVWGHLPPREKQDLSRTYSERYLPGYEEQVRRYFERLSRLRKPQNNQGSE